MYNHLYYPIIYLSIYIYIIYLYLHYLSIFTLSIYIYIIYLYLHIINPSIYLLSIHQSIYFSISARIEKDKGLIMNEIADVRAATEEVNRSKVKHSQ